jgi:hypothetical protein
MVAGPLTVKTTAGRNASRAMKYCCAVLLYGRFTA